MSYGELKIDTITFTSAGVDTSVSVSGLVQNPTFTGNITTTGTISGDIIRGNTISGVTVIGTTEVSGATVTGDVGLFGTITGGIHTLTSGVFASGTAGNPSITFVGDLDTGLFTGAANTISMATNGAAVLTASGTNVGIGTTSPSSLLHVNGEARFGASEQLRLTASSTEAYIDAISSGGNLVFRTNAGAGSLEHARIDSNGKVGIGTSSPDSILHLSSATGSASPTPTELRIESTTNASDWTAGLPWGRISFYSADTSGNGPKIDAAITASKQGTTGGNSALDFWTDAGTGSGLEKRLTITPVGDVGIGTGSPGSPLHIVNSSAGTADGIELTNFTGNSSYVKSARSLTLAADFDNNSGETESYISFETDGTQKAVIDSSGRLLVGTSTARANFDNSTGTALIQAEGINGYNHGIAVVSDRDTANLNFPAYLRLCRSGATSLGSNALVADNCALGRIDFSGADGTDFVNSASITAEVDGTPGANDMPGRLVFATTADGGSSPTERMRIDSSGNVGIGTTSPDAPLEVVESSTGSIEIARMRIEGQTNNPMLRIFADEANQTVTLDTSGSVAGTELVFSEGSAEAVRIDSSGRFLVGTSSARSAAGVTGQLLVEGTAYSQSTISAVANVSSGSLGAFITLAKTRGSTIGSSTIVNVNDTCGDIRFAGADGTNLIHCASILARVDGTPGANDMPGRLVFSTTELGAANPAERMRITNEGDIWIGQTTVASPGYGNTGIGLGFDNSIKTLYVSAASDAALRLNRNSDGAIIDFRRSGSASPVGSISVTTTATAYNTSSDYRLKENITAVTDGITRLQQLKPSRFNFIADPDKTVDGFLAHEVQDIVPEAITGEKDAVDDEGNPQYQGIDQSKLVPLLTAALQEAIGRIETLEAEVAALKGA